MRTMRVVSVTCLGLLMSVVGLAGAAPDSPRTQSAGASGIAYVHDQVRDTIRECGEARVIVVMGDPALPQAWARDWRERGPAIEELARRVRADAPGLKVSHRYEIFPFLAGTVDEQGLRQLAGSPAVEAVHPDRQFKAALAQSGPLIGQPSAEGGGFDGAGIGIAVLDTGIDYTHPDLGDSATSADFPNAKVVGGYDFVNDDTRPMDDNGHGTYCGGIAAGTGSQYRGMAPAANLIAVKVLDGYGLGYSSVIIEGIAWCITHKADYNIKVLSLSLSDSAEWRDPADCDADPQGDAITDAVNAGLVVVVAAGNEGYTRGIGLPACATDAIAVGATWDSGPDVDTAASFSNRGELLDIYAPGIWITSARWSGDPEGSGLYLTGAGTSASAPHVAGAAAVVFDILGDGATAAQVTSRLTRTGVQALDESTGVAAPRVDLTRAMNNEPTSGPDLIVTAVASDMASGLVGTSLNLSITIQNQGDAPSAPCKAIIGMSENRVASPQDYVAATVEVPAIAAGDTWSSGTVSGAVPGARPGTYYLVGSADSQYDVAEKDETNNGRTSTSFRIDHLSSYISSTTIPSSMLKGESRQVSVTVRNDGTTAWASAGGYALSSGSPLGNNLWGISELALPASVGPEGTVTFTFSLTAPSQPGLYPCHWQMVKGDMPFGEMTAGAVKVRVVDDAEWGQGYPAVDGDLTAYEDYGTPSMSAVSVTSLTTGATWTFPDDIPFPRESSSPYAPLPPYENFDISFQFFPDVSGPWVTWMVDDYPNNVWRFQITAQNVQAMNVLPLRITLQDDDSMFPAIDGDLVVWEDYRNDPDGTLGLDFLSDNPDIYICDISAVTGPTDHFPRAYPLCTAPGPQFSPRISGDLVVWEDWRDLAQEQPDLYLYDLSVDSDGDGLPNWKETSKPSPDPAEIRLTDTPWPEEYPDISGQMVVWMDLRRDTGLGTTADLYLRDLDGPTTPVAVATEPPTFRYHPRMDWPLLVWEDYTNDPDGPSGGGSLEDLLSDNPDIHFRNLRTGMGGPIAASRTIEAWPDVSGNHIVYHKHRATVTHTDFQGAPYDWPVFNVWAQLMPPEGMVGVCTFTDVPATFWAWQHIEAAVANGVVKGYDDGTYQPSVAVTRDQMAVYVARALAGGDSFFDSYVPSGEVAFSDVPDTFWAYKYIAYCADPDQDVVKGFEDGTYQPGLAVNRGQMAAYIGRAIAGGDSFFESYVPTGGPTFPDVLTDFWAYKYVEYIADAGVTQGYPDGKYHPEVVVNRDQMAVYISRAFGYVE